MVHMSIHNEAAEAHMSKCGTVGNTQVHLAYPKVQLWADSGSAVSADPVSRLI